jgi:hypothetical protein
MRSSASTLTIAWGTAALVIIAWLMIWKPTWQV